MAKDAGDAIGAVIGTIAREVSSSLSEDDHGKMPFRKNGSNGALTGPRGLATGLILAGAAPLAGKAVKKLAGKRIGNLAESANEAVGKGVKDAAGDAVDQVGGAPGIAKTAMKSMLPSIPGLGGGGGEKGEQSEEGGGEQDGAEGVGKGRRMPVQQAVDIAVPISVAYNQWTQFEEWPQFMHRLDQASQEDDCTVSFRTKIWGMSRQFVAQIEEQRPEERIQWSVKEGVSHSGVVTFHELAPRLTRVQVSLDVEPGSWLEKAARGMRHVKRAVRGDMARFKAFIEMQEEETGAWRGVIHEGEVVEQKQKERPPKKEAKKQGARKQGARKQGARKRPSRRGSGGGSGSKKRSTAKSGGKRRSPH